MNHSEQRERTHELLQRKGLQRALFTNISSVKWLTGFAPPIQLGPNYFAGGPTLVWYDDGHFTVVVQSGRESSVAQLSALDDCDIITYPGYTIEQPIHGGDRLREAITPLFRRSIGGGLSGAGAIGIEAQDTTMMLSQLLDQALAAKASLTSIDGWLVPLRAVKSAEEIQKLRDNFALTDIGHAAARRAIQGGAGKREIDVWTEIHSAVQQAAGERVPLGNDCVVGYRAPNNIGGWPGDLEIRSQDNVIVDLSTVLHGYWSDSCATYYADEPTADQVKLHKTCEQALAYGISLIKPGAIAKEIDQKVRNYMRDAGYAVYPHHTGHGVGVTGHEEPRVVPYNDWVLEPNMVILLEPGAYFPGQFGARLEDAVLVTADGAEVLTKHDKSLP